jgi:hypothetical protein
MFFSKREDFELVPEQTAVISDEWVNVGGQKTVKTKLTEIYNKINQNEKIKKLQGKFSTRFECSFQTV